MDFSDNLFYIGLEEYINRATGNLEFFWSNNAPVDYLNWENGQPQDGSLLETDCYALFPSLNQRQTDGGWFAVPCYASHGVLCKKPYGITQINNIQCTM